MTNPIDALRGELIREGETDLNGGGWSDSVIDGLRPGHRDLQDSLRHISSASDLFATPRQRALARQALGVPEVSRSEPEDLGEMDLLEALAGAL